MQNKSKLNTVLLVIVIILLAVGVWAVLSNKKSTKNVDYDFPISADIPQKPIPTTQVKPTPTVQTTLVASRWGDRWPQGWVYWEEVVKGEKIEKIGPQFSDENYIVTLSSTLRAALYPNVQCVGDLEISTCLIGADASISAAFKKFSNDH